MHVKSADLIAVCTLAEKHAGLNRYLLNILAGLSVCLTVCLTSRSCCDHEESAVRAPNSRACQDRFEAGAAYLMSGKLLQFLVKTLESSVGFTHLIMHLGCLLSLLLPLTL